ncbi:hypothetical protein GCM10010873_03690 [Cypionkella aquatica]|uniref:Uncharacterized protein n=1 Tax=Cypionkella aquatica TaxID=1756042 RepID=A0AA37TYC4_9RHOB|nr:hypothetical protein GCM10010873_03690 [Cypionkella aquatica]
MLVGLIISAISGGTASLLLSLLHDVSLVYALLSYPLGGMLAIALFAGWCFLREGRESV